jgi:hypothetical protein
MTCPTCKGAISFLQYNLATARKETAYAEYNSASRNLDLKAIQERLAELQSQSLESVGKGEFFKATEQLTDREREIGLMFARYAVIGRCL